MLPLKNIANVLQKEETDFLELKEVIREYETLVTNISNLNLENESHRSDIHFENGKALGTTWAAMCIQDLIRTKTFIKGVFKAIESARKTKQAPINILYAGTGPFATLALPVMASFSPDEVQFTLLEINKASFKNVRTVIQKLRFGKYVESFVCEDATNYKVNPAIDYDIVLSETMQRALEREQQVPIVMNLLPQLKSDALLIPENISLELCLINMQKLHERKPGDNNSFGIRLGTFFELNSSELEKNSSGNFRKANIKFPAKSFAIPQKKIKDFNMLAVLTDIQVFGDERIKINESGLTIPLILEDLTHQSDKKNVVINYKIDEIPGVEYRLLRS